MKSATEGARIFRRAQIDAEMVIHNAIYDNKYLESKVEGQTSVQKFFLLARQYYEDVKSGKQFDLDGKRTDYAPHLKELINSMLPDSEKINEEDIPF
ncbi:MAG: hypothetical protein WC511_01170 [Candidatus Pacearchaeota archaeon]|jgi:hypothetical protein